MQKEDAAVVDRYNNGRGLSRLSLNNSSSNSGQVYDPVFGWIDTGSTHQDTVDSSGSINKQIGSMN